MRRSELRRNTPLARGAQGLARSAPLAKGKPKQRAKITATIAGDVARRSGKRCVRCGSRHGLQRHHVLPVSSFPQYETVALCMVLACAGCHDEHERAHRRLRMDELPGETVAWAVSRGGREAMYMERTYR